MSTKRPMATMVANCFFAPGKVNLQLRIQKALEILEKQVRQDH